MKNALKRFVPVTEVCKFSALDIQQSDSREPAEFRRLIGIADEERVSNLAGRMCRKLGCCV